ncbi:MAG: FtsH protease activity modulator HflK [Synergistaceae bacterium]|jgi:membrane protease subunit HflK|nr:FtsH protease activity modulator HflK [Synergistaceae bacterium]
MSRKEKTVFIAIIANIALIILRFVLANISGSVGLKANAWHSFADVFVSSVVFCGLIFTRIGMERLKKTFTRAENVLAIFVSLFIFYMGVEIMADALGGDETELRYVPFAAAGAFIGVAINYFMARYKIYVGEQTGSKSLIADGYHSMMDMYCSIAVLVGLIGSLAGMNSLDKIAAIIAMVMTMTAGFEIFRDNARALLRPEGADSGDVCCPHHHASPNGRKMYAGLCAALAAAYLLSGVFFVGMDEAGIVLRFGAVVNGSVAPGINYRLPFPFERVAIVKKDLMRKLETGVQELLTGDTNLLSVNMSVHYTVENPADFYLNVSDVNSLIRMGATAGIREIAGRRDMDYLLTEGRAEVESRAESLLQGVMDTNKTGVRIVSVQMVEASPPAQVMSSFQDLANARQDQSVYINEALAYRNTIIPQSNADAYTSVARAQSYRDEKIKTAEGDASLFAQKLGAYATAKDVTEFRLYIETMDRILPNTRKILLGGDVNIDNMELWITNNSMRGGN